MNAHKASLLSSQMRPTQHGKTFKPLSHEPAPKDLAAEGHQLNWIQWTDQQRQNHPVQLEHQLKHRYLSVSSSVMPKTILVIQKREKYARFWQQILSSQGHRLVIEPPQQELMLLIERHRPDLVLVDMSIGSFNPYALCRECRSRCPDSRVVLTHPSQREVQAAERRWAIYQGASELLTTPTDPMQVADCLGGIYRSVGWQEGLDQLKLMEALQALKLLPKPEVETTPPMPIPEKAATKPPQKSPTPLMYRGRPVVL